MIDTAIIRQRILDKLLYEDINNDVEELKWSAVSKNIQYGISEKITNNGPLRVVRITDLAERKINWNTVPFHTLQKGCLEHYLLKDGDILFARSGATVGKSVLVKDPPDNTIFAGYLIRSTPDQSVVLPVYASYYFQTSIFWSQLSEGVTSTAQPNFNGKKLGNLKLRVPPLEEQKRIVAKIEELFTKIDEIDKAQKELKELAELAEKKVLDMAVRGELVEQDETDQSAEQFISNVKDKIDVAVSKKVIRKKAVTPMLDADIPYDIPGNWCWEKIGALFAINPKNVGISDNDIVGFVPMTLMDAGISNHHEYEEKPWKEIKKGFTALQNGDLAIAKITPCFQNRKSGVIQNLPNGVGGGTTEFHVLRDISHTFDMRYALALVQTQEFIDYGVSHFSGAVGQQRVSKEALADYPFPVPPFEEQQRIGEKIEEYLSLIKTMI